MIKRIAISAAVVLIGGGFTFSQLGQMMMTSGGAVTDPIADMSGLIARWHADTVYVSGTTVTNWPDITGSGYSAIAGGGTVTATNFNGRASLRFGGGSDFLSVPAVPVSTNTFVFIYTRHATNILSIGLGITSGARPLPFRHRADSLVDMAIRTTFAFSASANSATGSIIAITSGSQSTPGDYVARLNGTPMSMTLATATTPQPLNVIGRQATGYHNGHIHEIAVFDRVLTLSEMLAIESYAITKWGVSP